MAAAGGNGCGGGESMADEVQQNSMEPILPTGIGHVLPNTCQIRGDAIE
jgi:hypothetical protein